MALATAWFRVRSNRAYRRVRERLGLVTATLAEDIAGMRVVQSFTREPQQQASFRGDQRPLPRGQLRDGRPERRSTSRSSTFSSARDRDRARVRRLPRLPRPGDRSGRCSRSRSTSRTSSTRSSSSRSSTTRFSPRSQRWTRSSDVLDEEPEIVDGPGRTRAAADRRARRFETSVSATAAVPEVLHGLDLDVPPERRSRSSATRVPASRRSRSCSRASTTRARAGSRSTATTSAR